MEFCLHIVSVLVLFQPWSETLLNHAWRHVYHSRGVLSDITMQHELGPLLNGVDLWSIPLLPSLCGSSACNFLALL